jgi:hypothetical protein
LGLITTNTFTDATWSDLQSLSYQHLQAIRLAGSRPALSGYVRRHNITHCTCSITQGYRDLARPKIAASEGETHFQPAKATFEVALCGKDHHDLGIENAIEQTLWELIAIVDRCCIEKREISQSVRQGLGIGPAGAPRVRDEDRMGHCSVRIVSVPPR